MANMEDFSADTFNPIEWLNSACSERKDDEPLERYGAPYWKSAVWLATINMPMSFGFLFETSWCSGIWKELLGPQWGLANEQNCIQFCAGWELMPTSVFRFLAELEMKLQLSSEDLEISLEECTSQVLRRIPLVMHEVTRLQVLQLYFQGTAKLAWKKEMVVAMLCIVTLWA